MTEDEAKEYIAQEVRRQMEAVGRVLVVPPKEVLRQEFQRRGVEEILRKAGAAVEDSMAWSAMRFMLAHDEAMTASRVGAVLSLNNIQAGGVIKKLSEAGVIARVGGGGNGKPMEYRPVIREWIEKGLAAHNPTEEDIEQTYQAVLGRLAGVSA